MRDCLVATDMDGTLLNHHDYRYDAALPCLQELQRQGIPVILNTSKTFSELEQWRIRLDIQHPFIVENGAAIFIPRGYFADQVIDGSGLDIQSMNGYSVVLCGKPIEVLQAYLAQHPVDADDLSSCSLQQAVDMTGLEPADAQLAQTRDFSIPLRFPDEKAESVFTSRALADGFGILKGGRFLHLIGETDKGRSQLLLKSLYEKAWQKDLVLIALGDSPNDGQMLESADIAVLVNSPSSAKCEVKNNRLVRTVQRAPEGWTEGIERALAIVEDNG